MNLLLVIGISVIAFGLIVLAMAVGVIFRGRCIRGSCGGQAIYGPEGELLNCDSCPVRRDPERIARESGGTRVPASK